MEYVFLQVLVLWSQGFLTEAVQQPIGIPTLG